jgi:hypothetical protein
MLSSPEIAKIRDEITMLEKDREKCDVHFAGRTAV